MQESSGSERKEDNVGGRGVATSKPLDTAGQTEEDAMSAKIFYRERHKVGEKEKKPRFNLVAVTDINMKVYAKHLRKQELEQIAQAVGAELVLLSVDRKGDGERVDVER